MRQWLTAAWHRGHPLLWLLWPLTLLYAFVTGLRRFAYRARLLPVRRFRVPVIIVGNVTVGGTGKTPLTLALIERLRAEGFRPGVVSRGYGGKAAYPLLLDQAVTAAQAGDEPVAIFRRAHVPVVVDPKRTRAVATLLREAKCDVVLCDDGLQHYALARDIEIVVVDALRGLGNRQLLPAGPLREPASRLARVDYVVVNGSAQSWPGAFAMQLQPQPWRALREGGASPPPNGARLHAVAGIGNPERFFTQLRQQGFDVVPHAFPDHHAYVASDLDFGDGVPVVMTEKDAVKCAHFAAENWWYVPVAAQLPEIFFSALLRQLRGLKVSRHA